MQIPKNAYWLALRRISGMGPSALRRKLEVLGDIKVVWDEVQGNVSDAQALLDAAIAEVELVEKFGAQILTLDSLSYPQSLRALPDISPILYVKGEIEPIDAQAVAIVGTRRPSRYGIEVTQNITRQLVGAGYTIVSGMAMGVDAIAHRTALENNGRTIAVWGSGLDKVFPAMHKDLANQIAQNGAIVSQFPLGTEAQSFTFPARNKIIAGLSQAVVVTEAQAKSGSLQTAEAGLKYGRRVGAIPGSILAIGSDGPHLLIKNGARLIVDAADIVDTLATATVSPQQKYPQVASVTALEQTVLNQLQTGPQQVDDIIRHLSRPAAEVVGVLSILEIKGLIKQLAPGEYLLR